METRSAALRRLQELLCAGAEGLIVNLAGPLGVGKTTLLDELGQTVAGGDGPAVHGADCRVIELAGGAGTAIVIDGVDSAPVARGLLDVLGGGVPRPVVVTSRLPLLSRAGWARYGRGLVTVSLPAWPDSEIRRLAAQYQFADQDTPGLVAALSGGIPLIADCLCRAVAGGTRAALAGAMAGPAADEILRRLERERLTSQHGDALLALAVAGEADEELLDELTGHGGPSPFPALSRLSITTRSAYGLSVKEPYRVLLDLTYRWRRPLAHQGLLTKAAVNRRRLLAATAADGPAAAGVATQLMFLTGHRTVRDSLFPSSARALTIRPAQPGDEEVIARFMHKWAQRGGLSTAKYDVILDAWMGSTPNGFHLAVGEDGRPVAVANMLPVSDQTEAATELLLQQHAEKLAETIRPGQAAGLLIGMSVSEDGYPAANAALLRHFLVQAIEHGRALVSTPWPAYQQLARSIGFVHHGDTLDDLYHCGRQNEIYDLDFAPEHLAGWLDRLYPAGRFAASDPEEQRIAAQVRRALRDIHRPARLTANPLLAWLELPAAEDFRDTLLLAIQELRSSATPADADAGHVLADYYLSRRGAHEHVANRLHLSRSTYFRRLNHGIALLATRLPRPAR